jgi:hypothetical protein
MPEWLMGEDCKSSGFAYAGSNPARPKKNAVATVFEKKEKKTVYQIKIF